MALWLEGWDSNNKVARWHQRRARAQQQLTICEKPVCVRVALLMMQLHVWLDLSLLLSIDVTKLKCAFLLIILLSPVWKQGEMVPSKGSSLFEILHYSRVKWNKFQIEFGTLHIFKLRTLILSETSRQIFGWYIFSHYCILKWNVKLRNDHLMQIRTFVEQ